MPYDTLIPLIAILPIAGFAFTRPLRPADPGPVRQARRERRAAGDGRDLVARGDDRGLRRDHRQRRRSASTATGSRSGSGSRPASSASTAGFFVDALTACLLIVVTTIGLLVHIYSVGYMSHDGGYWRFFAYLNLFMFSMLCSSWPTTSWSSSWPGSSWPVRATC